MLRQGSGGPFAVRLWSGLSCVAGTIGSCDTAAASLTCSCKGGANHLLVRWLSQPPSTEGNVATSSSGSQLSWPSIQHVAAFSTTSSLASAAMAKQSGTRRVLTPAADIPTEARARLADELDSPGATGDGKAARGRRGRRRLPSSEDSAAPAMAAVRSTAADAPAAAATDLDDAEVKAVFGKLVGGLTKSGRKHTARRIVLDAIRIMREHLRKGNLEELK